MNNITISSICHATTCCRSGRMSARLMLASALATVSLLCAGAAQAEHHENSAVTAGLDIPSGSYGLDKTHAYITFAYSHMGFSTPHVSFNEFDVSLDLNADDPARSQFKVVIDASSIDSRVSKFDEHLRGTDYFDTTKHPSITFVANEVTVSGATTASVTGELTIKGVTKPLTLDLTLNKAANHPMMRKPVLGVSATGKLKRSEWGLGKYAPAVGDEVTVYISVELPKQG